ncbi:MAG TPA: MFS transporter [Acetobacteraceae bacterium]|nr:MFS transporter [Acetobacteraceae bacterium]
MSFGRSARVSLLIGTGHFLSHFYQLCLPPLFLVWQRAFGVSFAEVGVSVAVMAAVTALLQTPVGFWVDRCGARPFLIGGAALMTVSIALMGFATSFWQIVALALFSGLGNSVIHPADYSILSGSIAHDRMGRAFALHTFAGNLGFAAAPPVMAGLVLAFGWRAALLAVGVAGIPLVAAIVLQSGILADAAPRKPAVAAAPHPTGRHLLLSRPMLQFFGFYLLGSMAGAGVSSWLVTVLHTVKGVDLAIAAVALTAYLSGTTAGVLLGGWFADRTARHPLMTAVLTTISAALVIAVAALPVGGAAAVAMLLAAGLAIGATRTPRDVMLKARVPAAEIGKVFGFVSAGLPLGSALTPVPFGFLIDHGRPELVLILVAALMIGSIACMLAATASVTRSGIAAVPAE